MNITIVRGSLSRAPEVRDLPSGSQIVAYEVTVSRPGERAESVPVVWADPPSGAGAFAVGAELVVVGRVRRRFFRAGGATQSRTEVVADTIVPATNRRRVSSALTKVRKVLDAPASATG